MYKQTCTQIATEGAVPDQTPHPQTASDQGQQTERRLTCANMLPKLYTSLILVWLLPARLSINYQLKNSELCLRETCSTCHEILALLRHH